MYAMLAIQLAIARQKRQPFYSNNVKKKQARPVKLWMEDHQTKTLSWPSQSPDLNPTENLSNVSKRVTSH